MAKRIPPPPPRTISIADAVSEAVGEYTSLGEEMRSWADNIEEKFSQTDKYQRITDAADTLENISEPDYPDSLDGITVTIQDPKPQRGGSSRAARRDQASYMLQASMDELDSIVDDEKTSEEVRGDAETLRDEIDNIMSEADGVEFPGMYG